MPNTTKKEPVQNNRKVKQDIKSPLPWTESYISLLLGIVVVVIVALLVAIFIKYERAQQVLETASSSKSNTIATVTIPFQHKSLPLPLTVTPSIAAKSQTIAKHTITSKTHIALATPTPIAIVNVPEQSNVKQTNYTVQPGDNLWSIAVKTTGSGYNWTAIAKANNLMDNPGMIFSGNTLIIPTIQTTIVQVTPQTHLSQAPPQTIQHSLETSYLVQSGDNLWSIAVKTTGSGYNWTAIAKANNLINPGLIHVGNVLTIPPPQKQ